MQILDGKPICFTQKDIALIKKKKMKCLYSELENGLSLRGQINPKPRPDWSPLEYPPPPSHGEGLLCLAGLVG